MSNMLEALREVHFTIVAINAMYDTLQCHRATSRRFLLDSKCLLEFRWPLQFQLHVTMRLLRLINWRLGYFRCISQRHLQRVQALTKVKRLGKVRLGKVAAQRLSKNFCAVVTF